MESRTEPYVRIVNHQSPTDDHASVDDLVDECCDALEQAWRNGQRPNIADFIRPVDASYRNKLFGELLLADLECRRSRGEQPSPNEYLREFPQFATQIEAVVF